MCTEGKKCEGGQGYVKVTPEQVHAIPADTNVPELKRIVALSGGSALEYIHNPDAQRYEAEAKAADLALTDGVRRYEELIAKFKATPEYVAIDKETDELKERFEAAKAAYDNNGAGFVYQVASNRFAIAAGNTWEEVIASLESAIAAGRFFPGDDKKTAAAGRMSMLRDLLGGALGDMPREVIDSFLATKASEHVSEGLANASQH